MQRWRRAAGCYASVPALRAFASLNLRRTQLLLLIARINSGVLAARQQDTGVCVRARMCVQLSECSRVR
jgi:hypothetical protein